MDKLISEYKVQLVEPECSPGSGRYGAKISIDEDISGVFPYLNAVNDRARYDHENKILILREPNQAFAFRPNEIMIGRVNDLLQAQQTALEIIERVNHIWQEREGITPRFTERKLPTVMDVFKLLPRTNCKKCGCVTCLAFAAELHANHNQMGRCPSLSAENREKILLLFSSK